MPKGSYQRSIKDIMESRQRRNTMVERTCLTCNAEYCKYASTSDGKDRYNYKLLFDCRNHGYTSWKEKIIQEPPKEKT